jgi:hypothetical protein
LLDSFGQKFAVDGSGPMVGNSSVNSVKKSTGICVCHPAENIFPAIDHVFKASPALGYGEEENHWRRKLPGRL